MLNKNKIFNDFPSISTEEWENKIKEDLKGTDYEKKLIWKTLEGINIKPYYRQEDLNGMDYLDNQPGIYPYTRSAKNKLNDWEIRQNILVDDLLSANKKARYILERGVNSITFKELPSLSTTGLPHLLQDIDVSKVSLHFPVGDKTIELAEILINHFNKSENAKGSLDYDPLGELLTTGNFYNSRKEDFEEMSKIIQLVKDDLPGFRIATVKGCDFKNSGASIVQELAFSLAAGNEYLVNMEEQGIPAKETAKKIGFCFAISSNYFMEIAKLRTARLLWSTILRAHGLETGKITPMHVHSITSEWNKTVYDINMNILRASTEAMSAIIGGTDSLEVNPHDSIFQKPDNFSERIARNIQIVLKEEAYLDKVIDPGAGSYYIESLTNSLAEKSWKLFQELEEKGGFLKACEDGFIQGQVHEMARVRLDHVANRKEILVGTNRYPNFNDKISLGLPDQNKHKDPDKKQVKIAKVLTRCRAAKEIEETRLKTQTYRCLPKVFLLTFGNPVMRKARAEFSAGFFACGGFDVRENIGFNNLEEGIEAALKEKSEIVVLCSSDDEYINAAIKAMELLKNKSILVIAGYPRGHVNNLMSQGILHFIHLKSNVLKELKKFQGLLHID